MATPAASCPVLVERQRELAVMGRVAAEVSAGIAQIVVLSGEAGAGKSRLAADFIGSLPAPWRAMVAPGVGSSRAFFTAAAQASTDGSPIELGAAVAASLSASTTGPLAVLLEDAHELDPALILALGATVEALGAAPVLLIVTFRLGDEVTGSPASGAMASLRRQARVVDLPVGPLTRNGVAAMAEALGRGLDGRAVTDVYERSGGNAFFAEELILATTASVSWTVTETVLRRVRAVAPEGRRIGELLAVAGTPLPRVVIETIDDDGATGARMLLDAGIAVETGNDEVSLRHALVGEVIRAHLTMAERSVWHAALAQCLQSRRDAVAAQVARHWLAAGDTTSAAHWASVAAEEASTVRAYVTANELYTIALLEPPIEPFIHAVMLEHAAVAAAWAGSPDIALMRAMLADARYREAGEPWRAVSMWMNPAMRHLPKPVLDAQPPDDADAAALIAASEQASLRRDYNEAAALARQALVSTRQPGGDTAWEMEAADRLIRAGYIAEGEDVLQRVLTAATYANDLTMVSMASSKLAESAVMIGDIDRAISLHLQSLAASERTGRRAWAVEVGLTILHVCRGDISETQRRIDLLLASDIPVAIEYAQLPATWVDIEHNDLEQAARRITRMAPVRTLGVGTFTAAVLLAQARWQYHSNDPQGALDSLDEADEVTGDLFEPGRPDRLILRARAAAALDDAAMVATVRADLEQLVERGGAWVIRAGVEWAAGLWARLAGELREACRRLQAAAEGLERGSRFVMAADAWCDLADVADEAGAFDLRDLAANRAGQLADERELHRVRARLLAASRTPTSDEKWPAAFDVLTPRQRDIAVLVAAGQSNRQIGERLFLSEHTVRNQLVKIFATLGVSRRSELAALASGSAR